MTDDDATTRNRGATTLDSSSSAPTQQPQDALVALDIGSFADRYEVRAYLGEGGMGAVYRAFDRVLDEEVALKVVHARYASSLRDEVKLAQKVTHPNVCRTYDLTEVNGQHVVKMEYVPGHTLAEVMTHGRVSIERVIAIARALGDGLAAAHAVGIVHRDLKPGNVMLAGERIVLMDFGLAQISGERSDFAGSVGYMSPEQMAGGAIDARSDLYALGLLVYEMLAGERLLGRGTFEQVRRLQRALGPVDVRAKRSDTPRWLARAMRVLLSMEPSARSAGVAMLARGTRWRARTFAPIAIAAVAIPALLVARGRDEPWVPNVAPVLPEIQENADYPALSPDGATIAYVADHGTGEYAIYTVPRAGGTPVRLSRAGCDHPRWSYAGDALFYICGRDDAKPRAFRHPIGGVPEDVNERALERPRGWEGGGVKGDPEASGTIERADWIGPCGRDDLLVVSTTETIPAIVIVHRDRTRSIVKSNPDIVYALCDREGDHLAYSLSKTRSVEVIARTSAGWSPPREIVKGVERAVAFTPRARSLVFVRLDGTRSFMYERSLDGGVEHPILPTEEHALSPDVSVDGSYLVFDRDSTAKPLFEIRADMPKGKRVTQTLDTFDSPAPLRSGEVILQRQDLRLVVLGTDGALRELDVSASSWFVDDAERYIVYFDIDKPSRLLRIPIAGGPVETVADLPGTPREAYGGPDGYHVATIRGGVVEGYVVAGGKVTLEDGANGLVMPARSGGWRAVGFDGADEGLRFVPPNAPLSLETVRFSLREGRPRWLDDKRFAFCDREHMCRVLDMGHGPNDGGFHVDIQTRSPISAGPDGIRWYVTEFAGQVTRHVITNFADRPWGP